MSEETKDIQEPSVKYIKVCDRHGYCVMKIKPEEKPIADKTRTQSKKNELIKKKKKETGKIFFKKEDPKQKHTVSTINQVSTTSINRRPARNPFTSRTTNKNRGKIAGMAYNEITLTTTDEGEEDQSE